MVETLLPIASFFMAVPMIYYHYKSSFEFLSQPGKFKLSHPLFVSEKTMTGAGLAYKKKFWLFWVVWVSMLIGSLAFNVDSINDLPFNA